MISLEEPDLKELLSSRMDGVFLHDLHAVELEVSHQMRQDLIQLRAEMGSRDDGVAALEDGARLHQRHESVRSAMKSRVLLPLIAGFLR
jgi:hypothetical protein